MPDNDDPDFLSIFGSFAGTDYLAHVPEFYTAEEANALKIEAEELWRNSNWLLAKLNEASQLLGGKEKGWNADQFEAALSKIAVSSYRIGSATFIHNSNKRKIRRDSTAPGRKKSGQKRSNRDQLLNLNFGRLIEHDLRGAKLHKAVLDLLAQEKLEPGQHKPSLRAVTAWATNHRRTGSWKPRTKTSAQS